MRKCAKISTTMAKCFTVPLSPVICLEATISIYYQMKYSFKSPWSSFQCFATVEPLKTNFELCSWLLVYLLIIMDPSRAIKITIWNARGARNKIEELFQFLRDEDVDICAISETKLSTNVLIRSNPNYIFIRNDRDSTIPGGGVAFAIRRGIRYEILPLFKTKVIETLTIKMFTTASFFLFTVIYFPGASRRGNTRII